jgi:hypothetical protein
MNKYEVYVQENLIGIFEGKNTGEIINNISAKIQDGSIVIDNTKAHSIKIVPVN